VSWYRVRAVRHDVEIVVYLHHCPAFNRT